MVVLVIPDRQSGIRLKDHLKEKYDISVTLKSDVNGIEELEADAFIIFRRSVVDDMNTLKELQGKVALLYGNMPIPVQDSVLPFSKLTGTLPGCVYDFMETIVGWQGESDLAWGDTSTSELEFSDSPSQSTQSFKKKKGSIAVFSPGGGVGKTTMVVHLAKLAEQARINVVIIETDEDKGGVLRYLGKQPAHVGLDSLTESDWENEINFESKIGEIVQSVGRIKVIPMVGTLTGLICNMQNVNLLHSWAQSQFDLIIYDLPPRLRDVMTYSVLQEADQVVLVAEPTDVLMDALQKHLRLCKEVQKFHDLPQKYQLLVNKVPEKEGLDPEEMANALGLPLLGVIPADLEHYDMVINRARFDIPADSPWRMVAANLGIGGGCKNVVPISSHVKGNSKTSKERKGILGFFFGTGN